MSKKITVTLTEDEIDTLTDAITDYCGALTDAYGLYGILLSKDMSNEREGRNIRILEKIKLRLLTGLKGAKDDQKTSDR